MANIKHFADIGNRTIEFTKGVDHRGGKAGTWGWDAETRSWIRVTRSVEYKRFASKHECDARCMFATGKIMKCECSCGGKNHGRGNFSCSEAA